MINILVISLSILLGILTPLIVSWLLFVFKRVTKPKTYWLEWSWYSEDWRFGKFWYKTFHDGYTYIYDDFPENFDNEVQYSGPLSLWRE